MNKSLSFLFIFSLHSFFTLPIFAQSADTYFVCERSYDVPSSRSGIFNSYKYNDITSFPEEEALLLRVKSKWGLLDKEGKKILPFQFNDAIKVSERSFLVRKNQDYLLYDLSGKVLQDFGNACFKIGIIEDEKYIFVKTEGKIGLYHNLGKEIIPRQSDQIRAITKPDEKSYFQFWVDDKIGLVDIEGKYFFPAKFDNASILQYTKQHQKPVIIVEEKQTEKLFIGKEDTGIRGDLFVRLKAYLPQPNDYVLLKKLNQYGLVDLKTKSVLIPPSYQQILEFTESSFIIVKRGLYGIISNQGSVIIPPKYDNINKFSNDKNIYPIPLARISIDGKHGYLDSSYQEIVSPNYHILKAFSEGKARVMKNYKWGFIDIEGNEVIPLQFDLTKAFKNEKAEVSLNGKTFFIDHTGKCIENCNKK